jgi:magnesium chelatase family protein
MLARRLATLLPTMRLAAALETTRIPRVAGLTGGRTAVVTTRPFRAPHHTIAAVGVIGGGQLSMPGEMLLAHQGILVLDELPECTRHVVEVLRPPLERNIWQRQSLTSPRFSCVGRARHTGDAHAYHDGPVRAARCIP